MSVNPSRRSVSRRGWIIYGIVEVVLFLIANFTAKNADHPGTFSQIFFTVFIIGLVLAVMLTVATLIRRRLVQH